MANLNILVLPTYDLMTMAIVDYSTYPIAPVDPTIEVQVPGFSTVVLPFVPNETNIFNSTDFGITTIGNEEPLPDGVYCFKYTIDPLSPIVIDRKILRVDKLQEKFDDAFMTLDMMECDRAIKTQSKVELSSIYFFIQGAIASANNCAVANATKLYIHADKMLTNFINHNCGCDGGTNYAITFS